MYTNGVKIQCCLFVFLNSLNTICQHFFFPELRLGLRVELTFSESIKVIPFSGTDRGSSAIQTQHKTSPSYLMLLILFPSNYFLLVLIFLQIHPFHRNPMRDSDCHLLMAFWDPNFEITFKSPTHFLKDCI